MGRSTVIKGLSKRLSGGLRAVQDVSFKNGQRTETVARSGRTRLQTTTFPHHRLSQSPRRSVMAVRPRYRRPQAARHLRRLGMPPLQVRKTLRRNDGARIDETGGLPAAAMSPPARPKRRGRRSIRPALSARLSRGQGPHHHQFRPAPVGNARGWRRSRAFAARRGDGRANPARDRSERSPLFGKYAQRGADYRLVEHVMRAIQGGRAPPHILGSTRAPRRLAEHAKQIVEDTGDNWGGRVCSRSGDPPSVRLLCASRARESAAS